MKPNHRLRATRGFRQQGLATVLVALVLLIASTLIVFFLARSTVTEQRITGNEVRAKQAMAAAESGLDRALVRLNQQGLDSNDDQVTDDITGATTVGTAQYRVAFCEADDPGFNAGNAGQCSEAVSGAFACNTPAYLARKVMLVACGWSDDESARHFASRLIAFSPALTNAPTNPLTARGMVNVSGNMTVLNYYDNLTIWTGEDIDFNNATSKTWVRDPSDPQPEMPDFDDPDSLADYPAVPNDSNFANTGQSDAYVSGLDQDVISADIVSSDNSLATLSEDDLFRNYFGESKDVYRETVVTQDIAADDLFNESRDGQVIWVEGDVVINEDLGSRDEPVVLIVNGDVTFKGNAVTHGVIFSTETVGGETSASGTPELYGSLISTGSVDATGNLKIFFDPLASGLAARSGAPATVPGTWRDWP